MLVNNSTCCSDRVVIKDFEKCRKAFGFDDRAQVDTVGNRINFFGAVVKQAAAAEPDTEAFRYNYPECGITPRPGTLGSVIKRAAATNEKAALFCYPFVKCGTKRCGE